MLQIRNLSKKYISNNDYAIKDISFDVADGEIFGFLGPNGAGKSTTIKCIMGILPFNQGSIYLDKYNIQEDPIQFKKNIGYVSDNHLMYEKLTAREYVNFICDIFEVGLVDRNSRLKNLIEIFNLGDVFDNQISTFSHGMKQKLSIISALVHRPKLWIMDEPMMGLDPKSSYELKQLMKEYVNDGNSVFFSSHMLEIVEKICDKIAIIDKGTLIKISNIDDLKTTQNENSLEDFFLSVTNNNDEFNIDFN